MPLERIFCSFVVEPVIDQYNGPLHISFDMFLFAVESCDLSQADKIIIRVSSFSILQNFNRYTKNNYFTLGNLVFWSISSFKTKSKHLSQFFWWEINLRELRGFILQKIWALVAGRQKKKFCPWSLDLGRKKLL